MHVKHVWYGTGGTNYVLAHIVRSQYQDENGDDKVDVALPDGSIVPAGYRDPSDWDDNGNGGAYWNIEDVEGSNAS